MPLQRAFLRWVGGLATRVLEAGTGPPLVLLHGGIECGGVYWAPVINGLAGHYRVVVPDVPGLGESAPFHQFGPVPFGLRVAAILFGLAPSQRSLDRFTRWAFRDPEHLRRRDPGWYAAFRAYLVSRARVPHVLRTMRQLVRAGTRQLPAGDPRRRRVQ